MKTEIIKPNDIVEDVKKLLYEVKTLVAFDMLYTKWKIGNRILSEADSFPEGRPAKEIIHKTLTKLAEGLRSEYPLITQPRLSEMVQFRKIVGDNFELWWKTQLLNIPCRKDIRFYLLPQQKIDVKQRELAPPTECEQGSPTYPRCCEYCAFYKKHGKKDN